MRPALVRLDGPPWGPFKVVVAADGGRGPDVWTYYWPSDRPWARSPMFELRTLVRNCAARSEARILAETGVTP